MVLLFFSSRRRHTRLQGDWSSDVCSSDLLPVTAATSIVPVAQRIGTAAALPWPAQGAAALVIDGFGQVGSSGGDRKSTRLNSSHLVISYAVFCLKKKKKKHDTGETKT